MAESGEEKLLRGAMEDPSGELQTISNKSVNDPRLAGNPKVGDPGAGAAKWGGKKGETDPWGSTN